MKKTKLLFRATRRRDRYWDQNIRVCDNDTAIVDELLAKRLIKFFPDNFSEIEVIEDWEEELKYIIDLFNSPAHTYKIVEMRVVPRQYGDRLLVRYDKKL